MRYILIALLALSLTGCAATQKWTIEAGKLNLEQAKASREAIQSFMSTWSLNSGLIQCGTNEWITVAIQTDLRKMDDMVREAGLWSDDDWRKGCFAGVGTKLASKEIYALIQWAVRMAASAR